MQGRSVRTLDTLVSHTVLYMRKKFAPHTDGVEHESSRNTLGESAGRNAICLTRSTNYLVNEQLQRVKIDYAQRVCDNTIERVTEMRLRALACSLYALAGNSAKRGNNSARCSENRV